MSDAFGRLVARCLKEKAEAAAAFTPGQPSAMRDTLKPGDVLLVEGKNHISGAIKYLTRAANLALEFDKLLPMDDQMA
jgi:hypothetical protein